MNGFLFLCRSFAFSVFSSSLPRFFHLIFQVEVVVLRRNQRVYNLEPRECRNMYLKAEHKCSTASEIPSPFGPLLSLIPRQTRFLNRTTLHPSFHTFQPSSSHYGRKNATWMHDLCEDG